MRSVINLPRTIKPELIEPGDKIKVKFPPHNGITWEHTAVVDKIEIHGATRLLYTAEDSVIIGWEPGKRTPEITLLARRDAPQIPLSLFEGVG